jgi:threonine/homoserine/homoserine lactone efflux protein
MNADQAAAFFLFAVVAAITPGPANTLILATASAVGARRGLACVLGTSIGMGLLLFASALGLGQLVRAQPLLLKTMNYGGAILLLWLAWKIANAGRASDLEPAKPVGFLAAAAFQWVNPKAWLVAISAAGTYLQATPVNAWIQALTFSAVFFAAALPSNLVWLALGASLHRWLRDERRARIFNVLMALALALSIVLMFL